MNGHVDSICRLPQRSRSGRFLARAPQGFALCAQLLASGRCKACYELSPPNLDGGQFIFVFFLRTQNDSRANGPETTNPAFVAYALMAEGGPQLRIAAAKISRSCQDQRLRRQVDLPAPKSSLKPVFDRPTGTQRSARAFDPALDHLLATAAKALVVLKNPSSPMQNKRGRNALQRWPGVGAPKIHTSSSSSRALNCDRTAWSPMWHQECSGGDREASWVPSRYRMGFSL